MSQAFAPHLLTRASHRHRGGEGLAFLGDLALPRARVHELCGAARRTLALTVARATEGPVFWIAPSWAKSRLNPDGVRRFADPGRFTFLAPRRDEDLLWTMEEALRAGAVPLVVADLPAPPGLTPVRRLHLAAETGAAEGRTAPLGLILTPGPGGAPGVETRWSLAPRHPDTRAECWELRRLRARTAPERAWRVAPAARGGLTLSDPAPVTEK